MDKLFDEEDYYKKETKEEQKEKAKLRKFKERQTAKVKNEEAFKTREAKQKH